MIYIGVVGKGYNLSIRKTGEGLTFRKINLNSLALRPPIINVASLIDSN